MLSCGEITLRENPRWQGKFPSQKSHNKQYFSAEDTRKLSLKLPAMIGRKYFIKVPNKTNQNFALLWDEITSQMSLKITFLLPQNLGNNRLNLVLRLTLTLLLGETTSQK